MKYLILTGGLGNQMFEYAFLLALRHKSHKVVMDISHYDFLQMHNGFELERVFGIKEECVNKQGLHIQWLRFLNKFRPSALYMADKLFFEPSCLENPKKYIWGYWQDELYFKEIDEQVRSVFTFNKMDKTNFAIAQEMHSNNSVALHIRRGDYAAFGMNLMGMDYYRLAVKYITKKVRDTHFYVFSDDETVASEMANSLGLNYTLINHNKGMESYKDMYLMTKCKHNITANSSFSWWGAWLNGNKDKIVVAPKEWNMNNPSINPQPTSWVLI